ncbi:MAG: hypothetical protein QXK06_04340 [Candidatus Diapherotrites archaeon]
MHLVKVVSSIEMLKADELGNFIILGFALGLAFFRLFKEMIFRTKAWLSLGGAIKLKKRKKSEFFFTRIG